ncbi:MAG: glycosyltransferase family 4 protein [Promicromonosporaceae bacterium]|nr:glycosyltransferase family 4 protein [Promicromonosporaceae bacterium]
MSHRFEPVLLRRLPTLAAALGRPLTAGEGLDGALARLIDPRDRAQVWLTLSVLTGILADEALVIETARQAQLEPDALGLAVRHRVTEESATWHVTVERHATLLDVANTVTVPLRTGIQRVVCELAKRWGQRAGVRLIGWTDDMLAPRELTPAEAAHLRDGTAQAGWGPEPRESTTVIIPWQCRMIEVEVTAEPERAHRLRSLARFGAATVDAIAYDLIPITSPETADPAMPAVFAAYLSAMRHYRRLATISQATAIEYRGWTKMLSGAGLIGPDLIPVLLPGDAGAPADEDLLAQARQRIAVGNLPLVLVVGSHEPRKNHLAVLHAAEVLWAEGRQFQLLFIGGHAWRADEYGQYLTRLRSAGLPVDGIDRATDDLLRAAYALASFTVFPSLNEGFGLPVAESLATGTPVITSCFGSTKEIAGQGGGALLIDPRDDDDLIAAMRRLLTDGALLDALTAEAKARPVQTWDDYAETVWTVLAEGPVQLPPERG